MRRGQLLIAGPMEQAEIQRLTEGFGSLLGEGVVFDVRREESLLGGFVAYVGGRVYDMSLRTQLKGMRKYLQEG